MIHHLPRRAAVALSLGAGVVLLGACSGGSSKAASAPSSSSTAAPSTTTSAPADPTAVAGPDPCTLITKAEAEKLVGVTLQPPVTSGTPDDQLCQYTSDPSGPTAQVEVFVGAGAKKNLDIDKDSLQHDFTTLAGVGDEAYLESGNVFVRKGTVWVGVNVVALDAPEAQVQAGLTTQASTIAGRI